VDHLIGLVREMVPYFMENNSEVTAIDLLLEVDQLEQIFPFVNGQNAERIVEYLNNCGFYGVDSLEMQKTFKISSVLSQAIKFVFLRSNMRRPYVSHSNSINKI